MAVYYVYQGRSYDVQKKGSYIWAPQRAKDGRRNIGFTIMSKIRKGDFVLHHADQSVKAISLVQSDPEAFMQPDELKPGNKWIDDGWRVDATYCALQTPLAIAPHTRWLKAHYVPLKGSAFNEQGKPKEQYMCFLPDKQAVFLLQEVMKLRQSGSVLRYLQDALDEIVKDKDSEYEALEQDTIDELVDNAPATATIAPQWPGIMETQAMTVSVKTGREIPKRDPKRAADALARAEYLCEYDPADRTFLRKKGKPYTESHHLIPISKYRDFDYGLDVMENIVSLCSYCHRMLHYGRFEDKKPVLKKLYNDRIAALRQCGLSLTLEQLESYYE